MAKPSANKRNPHSVSKTIATCQSSKYTPLIPSGAAILDRQGREFDRPGTTVVDVGVATVGSVTLLRNRRAHVCFEVQDLREVIEVARTQCLAPLKG